MTGMIEQQSQAFLISILCGVMMGLIVGIVHEFKKVIKLNKVLVGMIDIVLWLALCGAVVMVTYQYSSGNVRLYIFFGFLSGFGIYFSTINWVISKILHQILCLIKNAFKKVILLAKKLVDIICHKG